jgi:hypothetical protein
MLYGLARHAVNLNRWCLGVMTAKNEKFDPKSG